MELVSICLFCWLNNDICYWYVFGLSGAIPLKILRTYISVFGSLFFFPFSLVLPLASSLFGRRPLFRLYFPFHRDVRDKGLVIKSFLKNIEISQFPALLACAL